MDSAERTDFIEIQQEPQRTFILGDVHGCAGEAAALLQHLVGKLKFSGEDLLVTIGDYIDRGPQSRESVELLLQFISSHRNTICLCGNHEAMLLGYLGLPGGSQGDVYLENGGVEALRSYEIVDTSDPKAVRDRIPPVHLQFFQSLSRYVVTPQNVYVHAGINPFRPIHQQVDEDIFWIREEFILNAHLMNKTVIFGHTPYEDVVVNVPYKIGVDTGCVFGGRLTLLELPAMVVHQVSLGERKVVSRKLEVEE